MRFSSTGALLLAFATVVGCGVKKANVAQVPASGTLKGIPSAQEAGQTEYKYAFSGQILSAVTSQAVKDFSVSIAGQDTAVNTVVNALGNQNGVFHISRNATTGDSASLPVVISAPGFQPILQMLNVGTDCTTSDCAGKKPLQIVLQPIMQLLTGATATPSPDGTSSTKSANPVATVAVAAATQLLAQNGANAVFQNLVQNGKLDTNLQALLTNANKGDVVKNLLVMLNGSTGNQTTNLITQILNSSGNPANLQQLLTQLGGANGIAGLVGGANGNQGLQTLLTVLMASKPGVGAALVAVNTLLPYLQSALVKSGKNGPLVQILTALTGGTTTTGTSNNGLLGIATLIQTITKTGGGNPAQLAMTGLVPLFQGIIAGINKDGKQHPFANLISGALGNQNLLNALANGNASGTGNQSMTMILSYLQPLLQGLAGKDSTGIAALFNELLSNGGIDALKNFPQSVAGQDKFAKLAPFIDQIVKGLNSGDGAELTGLLSSVLSKQDPSGSLLSLVNSSASKKKPLLQLASTLFPNLQNVINQAVPGKQLLSAQVLGGLVNGDLSKIAVTQDLQNSAGVVISATAQDVLKLAQLPNVDKIMVVGGSN